MAATITPIPKAKQAAGRSRKPVATKAKPTAPRATKPKAKVEEVLVHELPLDRISHGRNPRVEATKAELKALTESVKQHGVLQPIRVRPQGDDFQIVAGHRRYEAASAAKLTSIPVIVGVADDTQAYVQSLVENLQRQDLNPLDEARAFQILLDENPKLTQEALGQQVGRSQSYVANSLRLLGLEEPVKEALVGGKLTVAHAKAMASLPPEKQKEVAAQVSEKYVSSRDLEDRIRREKEDVKREEQRVERQKEMVSALLPVATAQAKKGNTIIVNSADTVDPFEAAGIAGVLVYDYHKHTENPQYDCDCKASIIVSYGGKDNGPSAKRACIVPDHFKSWKDEQDKGKKAEAKANSQRVDKARRAAANAMQSENGLLSPEGQRVALYMVLTRTGSYNDDKATAFVKRHGGPEPKAKEDGYSGTATNAQVWEAITGLTDKDLGKEFGTIVANTLFVNVFSDTSWGSSKDAAVRQFFVDQFGIDAEMVYGIHKPE